MNRVKTRARGGNRIQYGQGTETPEVRKAGQGDDACAHHRATQQQEHDMRRNKLRGGRPRPDNLLDLQQRSAQSPAARMSSHPWPTLRLGILHGLHSPLRLWGLPLPVWHRVQGPSGSGPTQ